MIPSFFFRRKNRGPDFLKVMPFASVPSSTNLYVFHPPRSLLAVMAGRHIMTFFNPASESSFFFFFLTSETFFASPFYYP